MNQENKQPTPQEFSNQLDSELIQEVPDKVIMNEIDRRSRERGGQGRVSKQRRIVAATALTGMLAGFGAAKAGEAIDSVIDGVGGTKVEVVQEGEPMDIHVVKAGESPTSIGEAWERNEDGIADNEDSRPHADFVSNQILPGNETLVPGQAVLLPTNADANPNKSGIQLDPPEQQ